MPISPLLFSGDSQIIALANDFRVQTQFLQLNINDPEQVADFIQTLFDT